MLTVDSQYVIKLYARLKCARNCQGVAKEGMEKISWTTVVHQTGTISVCHLSVIWRLLGICYSVWKQFQVFGIKDFTIVRYRVEPRYNNGNFICVFECTIVNLATYRQFTNAAWDWIIKKKKKQTQKQKQYKTKAKKKIQNCIKSGLSQFLLLQQKI